MNTTGERQHPRIELNVSASPALIWPESGSGFPKNSTISLQASATGGPTIAFKPQDTIFIMDCSQSMRYISDPNDLRLVAAKRYVENMIEPDRCTVVRLSSTAELVNNHSLTMNYSQAANDIASLYGSAAGQTNFESAFATATNELVTNGASNHLKIEIFLTDGRPEPDSTNITNATMENIIKNNITVFTIGLGPVQDRPLLRWIANSTGGAYYNAPNASALDEIYSSIANQFKSWTASYGGSLYYRLPEYIHYCEGTLSNSTCNITHLLDGTTVFSWNLLKMDIGDYWSVSFNISSIRSGIVSLGIIPDSRLSHFNYNHSAETVQFPDAKIQVVTPAPAPPPMPLPPPTPPAPMPVPPPALMSPVSQAALTIQPIFSMNPLAQPSGISAAELLAPFLALGIGNAAKAKGKLKSREAIGLGMRERNKVTHPEKKKKIRTPKSPTSGKGRFTS